MASAIKRDSSTFKHHLLQFKTKSQESNCFSSQRYVICSLCVYMYECTCLCTSANVCLRVPRDETGKDLLIFVIFIEKGLKAQSGLKIQIYKTDESRAKWEGW